MACCGKARRLKKLKEERKRKLREAQKRERKNGNPKK